MNNQIVAGIDIHKDFLVVTVLRHSDTFTNEYGTYLKELHSLKRWLARLKVTQVAIEATGIYMVHCLDVLKDRFDVFLVNPQRTRMIPGRKTDSIDSHWLATLLQKGLLTKSYIAPRIWREIREMVRQRNAQSQSKTRAKNRLHKILITEGYYLSSIYTDICGTTARLVIDSLIQGKTISEIVKLHRKNTYIAKHHDKLLEMIPNRELSENVAFMLQMVLNEIDQCELRIELLDDRVMKLTQVDVESSEQLSIIMSIPGFSDRLGKAILAEIGDISRFKSAKHLVSYAGMAPGIYESGGKKQNQRITKRGNKYLRTCFVEAAHAANKTKNSRLRAYYFTMSKRIGRKKALVALACKLARILHTLLIKGEFYKEDHFMKNPKLFHLPEPKRVLTVKEIGNLLQSRGLRISAGRR